MQKYLAQVEAISPGHLEKCKQLVRSFMQGPGPKLQQCLVERRQNTPNWVSILSFFFLISRVCFSPLVKKIKNIKAKTEDNKKKDKSFIFFFFFFWWISQLSGTTQFYHFTIFVFNPLVSIRLLRPLETL